MKLTIVGCAGSFPNATSAASCYLVEHDGHHIVLDLGSGALGPLQRYADLGSIDAVVLSHLHPDHCMDLTGYFVVRQYYTPPEAARIPVLAPPGAADRLARAYDMPTEPGMHTAFDFRDHVQVTEVGPFRIVTTPVVHPVPTYAARVEAGGAALVFSGDTAPTPLLIDLARGADLALFEASWLAEQGNPPGLHLSAREAGEHAAAADVPRLVLTHLVAGNDPDRSAESAAAVYDGELACAVPGSTFAV